MTPKRWQQINDLFQSAVERAPEERAAFLEEACHGDKGLRREVESLIALDERAEDFIESPAFEVAPELLTNDKVGAIVGDSIGHYRIESLIGVGGMGEVYLARDEQLGRKVALKFLPERLTADKMQLSRFKSEARAASALNHPNILTVHEISAERNRHFIAMEFIEGVTLRASLARGRMNVHDALEVALQVASALAAAHETGVVHRDIKPENIMLRPDGYVKVLDFGIAKLTQQPTSQDRDVGTTTVLQTHPGLLLGTARYLSPEQIRGQSADARSDIWSLGVVLYEMVAGSPPFHGETPGDCIASILKTEPPPLSSMAPNIPIGLQSVVQKALRKNRDERYQTIAEILADLRSFKGRLELQAAAPKITALGEAIVSKINRHKVGALLTLAAAILLISAIPYFFFSAAPARPQSEKSIAVLPFENLSSDPDNAYFAEGIQDEILTRLSKIADLKVISRTSTRHYKSTPKNLPEIAKQLGVTHILEGSVQKNSDGVRVNVQLIKAASDSHLWADTFDRKLTDIFSVETEVAKAIADQLRAKLTGQEEQVISAKPTDNAEAYDAYLRGLAYSLKTANTPTNAGAAQKYLRQAVRLDPKFAISWALLSFVAARGYRTATLQPTAALLEEARQAAETALTLQPNSGEAILAKGFYHYACLKDYDTAVRYFEQARPLLPNSSRIPELLAYVARKRGEWNRSETYFNEAERLDPRNVSLLTQHALSYKDRRLLPEAWRKLEEILNITPDDVDTIVEKGVIAQADGDLPRASDLLASVQPAADDTNAWETQAYQAILERRPAEIISRLKELLAKPDPALGFYNGELRFWLGWTQQIAGDHAAAQESWRQARSELESFLQEQPENYLLLADLALTKMSLGDKAAALTLAERAMTVNPIQKDALVGPASIEILARVAAQTGEADRAIAALQKLLSIPYGGPLGPGAPLTPALLQLDPMFDPLRSDPRFQKLAALAQSPNEKSIAVLPFENQSRNPDNAYFADGIQDEILTKLAAVRDLKVISRTSTAKYQSKPDNLKTVAQDLGVSTILEGGVQRAGDKVRVNVQLIDAHTDTHLWAKSYDRDLKDVLLVESEAAGEIVEALKANLSPIESRVLAAVGTQNTEAYDLFLRGEYEFHQGESSLTVSAFDRADAFYRQALAQDADFAEAAAALAYARLFHHWFIALLKPQELEEVKSIIDRALVAAPDSPEAHFAHGVFFYWGHRQYENALAEFNRTLELQPNNALARQFCGWVYRRRGEWERSLAYFQQAEELDPRYPSYARQIGETSLELRLWKNAERASLRALAIDPHNVVGASLLALTRLNGLGDIDSARRAFDGVPEGIRVNARSFQGDVQAITGIWVYLDVIERRFSNAFQAFEKESSNGNVGHLQQLAGHAALRVLAGQTESAKAAGDQALPLLEARLRERPDDSFAMTQLAWVYLAVGRNADALRLASEAAASIPIEKDALSGATFQNGLAQIEARAGAPEEAVKRLQRLLSVPAGLNVSIALLKIDPVWDLIRSRPDFQQLLSGTEQIGPSK